MTFLHIDYSTIPLQFTAVFSSLILCSLLGLERYYHNKNSGIKTHSLVGVGACVFTLISAYGFSPVLTESIKLDPSRVTAQIVSGIGFMGAGVIFVANDKVRGLTTAAAFWISAAIGTACGASMIPLAVLTLLLHYFVVFALGPLMTKFTPPQSLARLIIEYEAQQGVLPQIMLATSHIGCKAMVKSTDSIRLENGDGVRVVMEFEGCHSIKQLLDTVTPIEHVHAVDEVTNYTLD